VPVEESVVLVDGPWTHREVTANGARFHVAECGPADGPLVLLLHGFPEFWWSWRHQLVALGAAGFRAVAPDLRGYGASDKPPRGYDAYTLSSDVAGMVRALGARDAVLVGHDWGGVLAWSVATLHPGVVRGSPCSTCRTRCACAGPAQRQRPAAGLLLHRLLPAAAAAEAKLRRTAVRTSGSCCGTGAGLASPTPRPRRAAARRCRSRGRALRAGVVPMGGPLADASERAALPHAAEPRRGRADAAAARRAGQLPAARTAQGSDTWVDAPYELRVLPGLGHFPHQEAPELVSAALVEHAGA
jgi:pimeloyl-ACP methyl ester carboxylesterase